MRFLTIFLFLVISTQLSAEERMVFFYNVFSPGSERCNLIEKGGAVKKSYFSFKGNISDNKDSCTVSIGADAFNYRFKFCSISETNTNNFNSGRCIFRHNIQNNTYQFSSIINAALNKRASALTNSSKECSYVCLSKVGGDYTNK